MALRMGRQKRLKADVGAETVPVSIRFPEEALREIRRVAKGGGENASSWIRRQALAALRGQAAA